VQGANGAFDPATKTCSNVYCHGNFAFNAVSGSKSSPAWTDTTPLGCTSCHAMPPAGHPAIGAAPDAKGCAGCHPDSVNGDGTINLAKGAHLNGKAEAAAGACSSCHGDPTRVGNLKGVDPFFTSAPPVAPPNAPAFAVGAHLAHMNPAAATAMASPGTCADCHLVPTDSGHATSPPAQKVVFGPLATAGGASPIWAVSTTGCSATWCHGNFTLAGVSGSRATPLWTDTVKMTCVSCHEMPPAGHPPLAGTVTAATCSGCHPQSVDPQGLIVVASGAHMNGKAETAALGCTACHGDATRTAFLSGTDVNLASSPPVASAKAPAYAVGTHLGHVNPTAASALMGPIACGECHVVPGDSIHSNNPPAQPVVFGSLARTGGATPTWTPGTAGCAATYCHGRFTFNGVSGSNATPIWTDATPLTCASCHAMPPAGHPTYAGTPTAASCFQCHPQSVNADGTIKAGGGHLNGKAEGGDCKSCHGDPPTTGRHTIKEHVNLRCDACHPTGYTSTVAVATFHQNKVVDLGAAAGYSCGLTGCPTATRGTCTNKCHGKESW
jgi:predicted CxxxxCH...CXXCH cytochrome family protein